MPEKEIYIVVSQTGSIVSRILKRITGAEYNHASIALDSELHNMYSFGRRYTYFPWYGGFVAESPEFGAFKRFSDTRAVIISIPVTERAYKKIEARLNEMLKNKNDYHYDIIGLLLAYFNIIYKRDHHYYCSDFVRELLVQFGVEDSELFMPIVQPQHFLNIPDSRVVYRGKLSEYSESAAENG